VFQQSIGQVSPFAVLGIMFPALGWLWFQGETRITSFGRKVSEFLCDLARVVGVTWRQLRDARTFLERISRRMVTEREALRSRDAVTPAAAPESAVRVPSRRSTVCEFVSGGAGRIYGAGIVWAMLDD
jgi:hypothetical protein